MLRGFSGHPNYILSLSPNLVSQVSFIYLICTACGQNGNLTTEKLFLNSMPNLNVTKSLGLKEGHKTRAYNVFHFRYISSLKG